MEDRNRQASVRECCRLPGRLTISVLSFLVVTVICKDTTDALGVAHENIDLFATDETVLNCSVNNTNVSSWIFMSEECGTPKLISFGNSSFSKNHVLTVSEKPNALTNIALRVNATLQLKRRIFICQEGENVKAIFAINETVNGKMTVVVNTIVRIPCPLQEGNNVIWSYANGTGMARTALNAGNRTISEQYHIDIVSDGGRNVSYLVFNATAEVVGTTFRCDEGPKIITNASLDVEVPPDVWLQLQNGTKITEDGSSLTLRSNEDTEINCTASDGNPMVELLWKVDGEVQTTQRYSHAGKTERAVWSALSFRPQNTHKTISCVTQGQIKVPSIEVSVRLNVLYKPSCSIYLVPGNEELWSTTAICACSGRPAVTGELFLFSGDGAVKRQRESIEFSTFNSSVNITCRGKNSVGEHTVFEYIKKATRTSEAPPQTDSVNGRQASPPATLFVFLSLLLVTFVILMALAFSYYRKKHGGRPLENTYFEEEQASNHALMTLSARPRLESPEITRRVVDDGEGPYEDVPIGDEVPGSDVDPFSEVGHSPTKLNCDSEYQKPFSEESEYNATYFERPATKIFQNEYATADEATEGAKQSVVVSSASSMSSFSDEEYFRHQDIPLDGTMESSLPRYSMSCTKKSKLNDRKTKESVHW